MAIDTTAGTVAQNMLNGIDYSALIGGPLQAAISAQAMAAKSSWEFIQQVGLNTTSDGHKEAVNVTFTYQKDGNLTTMIVPILTIVPIPMIVIDDISIDFKASINASSSSCTENSESTALDVGGEAKAKLGWGPFSLSITARANYSSKKDSKATSESRYSVEYTQDVHVHAKQADVPAGLATVLNILTMSAMGDAGVDGKIDVEKSEITPTPGDEQSCNISITNASGLLAKGAKIKIKPVAAEGSGFQNLKVTYDHIKKAVEPDTEIELPKGNTTLYFSIDENKPLPPMTLELTATVNSKQTLTGEILINEVKAIENKPQA
ncbi:DUF2589 domain-containing protein [Fibrobacter succinogenes]|uniref:DUF2589 domain-containing protein n=1 Tax=Fibrobacter succinogenes TaxID=833 RepID=UPI0013D8A131|nr:DUF2589 domain-containing protein [Fibrobacter succinogenes]